MKYAAVFLLAALALGAVPARADVWDELRDARRGVLKAQDRFDDDRASDVRLQREIATFTSLIDGGTLNPAGRAIAHYWRGVAYALLDSERMRKKQPADRKLAEATLADFDAVIDGRIDVKSWGVWLSNALYRAGHAAYNGLEDRKRAYASYWLHCAYLGHGGCLNLMAYASLTGDGGVPVDLQGALLFNHRAADTWTQYGCAGPYSALTIAWISHFSGRKYDGLEDLDWERRGALLVEQLSRERGAVELCARGAFELSEFLMRLRQGDSRPELLRAVLARKKDDSYSRVARYFLGETDHETFNRAAAADASCDLNFYAYWRAGIAHNAGAVQRHLDAMSAAGEPCSIGLALAKLRNGRSW